MKLTTRPLTNVLLCGEETPVADLLETVVGPESLATWNESRKTRRLIGGEWDTLRRTPIAVRRRLTSAGFLSVRGMMPDDFSDMIAGRAQVGPDPIEWYIKTALRAIDERHAARRRAREKALARDSGRKTLFEHRDQLAKAAGFRSYYDYRMNSGWGDGHGRGID